MGTKILVIDNYDSFVYILVQYLGELGANPVVVRNDQHTLAELEEMEPDGILISPGPGRPEDAGISTEVISAFASKVPVFGVCLGHQCLASLYGAHVVRAPELMHGKTSAMHHNNAGVFRGLPNPLEATRYHSLLVDSDTVDPDVLEITAQTESGLIMGIRHKEFDVEGVQFHPESVLTTGGIQIVKNFLDRCYPPAAVVGGGGGSVGGGGASDRPT